MPEPHESERVVITPAEVAAGAAVGGPGASPPGSAWPAATQVALPVGARAPGQSGAAAHTAVPWWGIVCTILLAPCLPLLCLFALGVRIGLRRGPSAARLVWNSLLCTALIVSGLVTSLFFGLFISVRAVAVKGSLPVSARGNLDALDSLPEFPKLPAERALTAAELVKQTKPLVFVISTGFLPSGSNLGFASIGAGVLLAGNQRGYLLATNRHVIDRTGIFQIFGNADRVVVISEGGESAYASVVGRHQALDLALIWISRQSGHSRFRQPIRDYSSIAVGEPIFVIGHPQGLFFTLSNGLISRLDGENALQLSAPISPGNSGGPVYDANGNLLGIVTYKMDRASNPNAENLNFALRADAFLTEAGWGFQQDGADLVRQLLFAKAGSGCCADKDEERRPKRLTGGPHGKKQ